MIKVISKLKGGFLEQPTRVGAMLGFQKIKMEKLEARREKYRDGEYDFVALYGYFNLELKELEYALLNNASSETTLRELADISNAIDMMAWCLVQDTATPDSSQNTG